MTDVSTELDFETALGRFILMAFAEGDDIEGVWNLDSAPDEIPNWEVTIRKVDVDATDRRLSVDIDVE